MLKLGNKYFMFIILFIFGIVLASCSPQQTETKREFKDFYTEAELLQAAKEEGKVVFCTNIPISAAGEFGEEFEEKYGIKAEVLRIGSGVLTQKFYVENEAGMTMCDVINTGVADAFPDWKLRGWLESSSNLPEWQNFPDKYKNSEGFYAFTRLNLKGWVYNTNLLKKDDLPNSLKELTDVKWKGKIAISNPAQAGTSMTWMQWIVEELGYGFEYFEKLRENDVLVAGETGRTFDAVASGKRELALDIGDARYKSALNENAPVAWTQPLEGFIVAQQPSAIAKKAPHPFAAKLFMNYLMSRDGQLVHARAGMPSARGDVDYLELNPWMGGPIEDGWEPNIEETYLTSKDFLGDIMEVLIR